jgi:predicted AAA+ superfamily ATPase
MKATLNFDLDDAFDREAHAQCVKSLDMALALHEIEAVLRRICKYDENAEKVKYTEEFRTEFYDILKSRGIDLDILLS